MISPEEFKRLWDEGYSLLNAYDKTIIENLPFRDFTKEFLIQAGLPESCAPGLSFDQRVYYEGIKNIKAAYELENDDFAHYFVIGSADNVSICINVDENDQIFQIDFHHFYTVDLKEDTDYHEEYVPIMFMNSSIGHLANCLLIYKKFIDEVRLDRNDEAYYHILFTEDELTRLREKLLEADQFCLREKSFWWFELALLANRS